jgi:hypothetical protein
VLADLAGTATAPGWVNEFKVSEVATDGRQLSLSDCKGTLPCTVVSGALGSWRTHSQGGFEHTAADGTTTQAFVYRAASGHPLLVGVAANKTWSVGALRTAAPMRALGNTWSFWDASVDWRGTAPSSFTEATYQVTATDNANQTYTRQRSSDGRVDSFRVNHPRLGLVHRPTSLSSLNDGSVVTVPEIIALVLPGMGATVYGAVTTDTTRSLGYLGVSVLKP